MRGNLVGVLDIMSGLWLLNNWQNEVGVLSWLLLLMRDSIVRLLVDLKILRLELSLLMDHIYLLLLVETILHLKLLLIH